MAKGLLVTKSYKRIPNRHFEHNGNVFRITKLSWRDDGWLANIVCECLTPDPGVDKWWVFYDMAADGMFDLVTLQ